MHGNSRQLSAVRQLAILSLSEESRRKKDGLLCFD
jgi:hypothetical protein